MFCQLPDAQKAALIFIKMVMTRPAGTLDTVKQWITTKNWLFVSVAAQIGTSNNITAPTQADFAAVGAMGDGVQNALFTLAMVDLHATDDAKSKLAKALDTCCWGQVADSLVSSMSKTGLTFSGDDLHTAYNPRDQRICNPLPPPFQDVGKFVQQMVLDGELVGDFFSKSLPDFFDNDFTNFFKGTIPDFFKGDFANFFKDLSFDFTDAFKDFESQLSSFTFTFVTGLPGITGLPSFNPNPSSWF
jgi:hypothetical protein